MYQVHVRGLTSIHTKDMTALRVCTYLFKGWGEESGSIYTTGMEWKLDSLYDVVNKSHKMDGSEV